MTDIVRKKQIMWSFFVMSHNDHKEQIRKMLNRYFEDNMIPKSYEQGLRILADEGDIKSCALYCVVIVYGDPYKVFLRGKMEEYFFIDGVIKEYKKIVQEFFGDYDLEFFERMYEFPDEFELIN